MNSLNVVYFLTRALERVASHLTPRTLFAERLYWLSEDVRILRRVMRKVKQAQRYQQFSDRPGTQVLIDCAIASAARILGYWLYHRPMNHCLVRAGMCDANAVALRLASTVWLSALSNGWQHAFDVEMYASLSEAETWLAGQYVDEASMRADFS